MKRNKCCDITFRKTLEEVLYSIRVNKPQTIEELKGALEYAVKELSRVEKETNEESKL
jgi:hypothetical protein